MLTTLYTCVVRAMNNSNRYPLVKERNLHARTDVVALLSGREPELVQSRQEAAGEARWDQSHSAYETNRRAAQRASRPPHTVPTDLIAFARPTLHAAAGSECRRLRIAGPSSACDTARGRPIVPIRPPFVVKKPSENTMRACNLPRMLNHIREGDWRL